jgi:hypothetical protein
LQFSIAGSVGKERKPKLFVASFFFRSPLVSQLAQASKKGGDLSDPLIFHMTGDGAEFPALFPSPFCKF